MRREHAGGGWGGQQPSRSYEALSLQSKESLTVAAVAEQAYLPQCLKYTKSV